MTYGLSKLRSGHISGAHSTRGRSLARGTGREPGCSWERDISRLDGACSAQIGLEACGWLTDGADAVVGRLLVGAALVAEKVDAGV